MSENAHQDLIWRDRRSKEPRHTALRAAGVSRETAEKLSDAGHYSVTISQGLDAWQWISDDPLAEWLCRIIIKQDDELTELREAIIGNQTHQGIAIHIDRGPDDA